MKKHEKYEEMIPFYLNGTLQGADLQDMQKHLHECSNCQAEMSFWKEVRHEVRLENQPLKAPQSVLQNALEQIEGQQPSSLKPMRPLSSLGALIRAQIMILRSEIWLASLLVIVIGCIAAALVEKAEFFYFLAPLVAAAGLSIIYTPENDPVMELVSASPVSQGQILLARALIVFGYDLLLVLAGLLALSGMLATPITFSLLLDWLAPMTFLSSLALFLSLYTKSGNAVLAAYMLWILRYVVDILHLPEFELPLSKIAANAGSSISAFWNNNSLLFMLAGVGLVMSIMLVGRVDFGRRFVGNGMRD